MAPPPTHVWQPDEGFRLSAIRNRGILKATGEYVVFLDGDCVPRPHWLTRHAALAQAGRFVTGNRVLLSRAYTEHVLANRLAVNRYTLMEWWALWRDGHVNRPRRFLFLPDGPWRQFRHRRWKHPHGCNMAMWRRDLHTVGGFDERYEGWGPEDADLVARLIHTGIWRKDGRYAVPVIHLWHDRGDRSRFDTNEQLFNEVVATGATQAVLGLRQHDAEA